MYSCIMFKLKRQGYGSFLRNLVTPRCHKPCVPFGLIQIISFLKVELRSSIILTISVLIDFIPLLDTAVPTLIATNLPEAITLLTSLRTSWISYKYFAKCSMIYSFSFLDCTVLSLLTTALI